MNLEFADKLIELRKKHGYSQEYIANTLNVSRQAVSKWENGVSSPDLDNLKALSKLYNISIDELVNNEIKVEDKLEDIDDFELDDNEIDDIDDVEKYFKTKVIIGNIDSDGAIVTVSGILPIISIIVYLILGFSLKLWHPGWLIFFLVPIIYSFIEAIEEKDLRIFVYPILVTLVYLTLGFTINGFSIYWWLFITIPLYYVIATLLNKIIFKKK